MNLRTIFPVILLLFTAPSLRAAAADDAPGLKRMALVAGVNFGGRERVTLKYAHSDARAFARVLLELGGVEAPDITMLIEPSRAEFRRALEQLHGKLERARAGHRRSEVVVYYSGHADAQGLLMGAERLTYKEIRASVKKIPADIRIAVLDACAAGAMTRLKGGKKRPAFLIDESSDMKGHAFLTSNTEDEAAQESDRIRGSYFTHSLVSGLRGGADITSDGKVTLNEAYQYAFHETLARTEGTRGGAQHAGYDVKLSGTGEVVMTDLRGTSATLMVEQQLEGRLFIRDDRGQLVVELRKYRGRPVELGLEPGKYHVTLERGPFFQADVQVAKGKATVLSGKDLRPVKTEATVSRGGPAAGEEDSLTLAQAMDEATHAIGVAAKKVAEEVTEGVKKEFAGKDEQGGAEASGSGDEAYDTIPVSWALIPNVEKKGGRLRMQRTFHYYSFNLLAGGYYKLNGLGIGLLGQWAVEEVNGLQATCFANYAGRVNGIQGSAFLNIAREVHGGQGSGFVNAALDVKGGQGSGFVNFALDIKGGQGTGFVNFARDMRGGQGSGFVNFARDMKGGQGSGFVNITRDMDGGHGSGFVNVARDVQGGQGAGFVNVARDLEGGQGSGFVNVARDVQGGQGTGFVNAARDVHGGQVAGFVNLARNVKGFQAGIVNLARDVDGETVGILNLNKSAKIHPGIWMDEAGVMNLSLTTGMKHVYGIIMIGMLAGEEVNNKRLGSHGLGLGVRVPVLGHYIHTDVCQVRFQELDEWYRWDRNFMIRHRLGVSYVIYGHLRLMAGGSLNLARMYQEDTPYQEYIKKQEWTIADEFRWDFWPGFYAGVEF